MSLKIHWGWELPQRRVAPILPFPRRVLLGFSWFLCCPKSNPGAEFQRRRSSKPGGAETPSKVGLGPLGRENEPRCFRAKWRGRRKKRSEEAGVLPGPDSRSTHIALSSPAPTNDPSNQSVAGGVAMPLALPSPPLPSASLPAPGTAPWGPCRPAGDPPEPPKTSGS